MLGAPEVINMNALLIKSLGGRKVIDVGVFTGASSLGAALALPEDGVVVACDVSEEVGPQISAAISNTLHSAVHGYRAAVLARGGGRTQDPADHRPRGRHPRQAGGRRGGEHLRLRLHRRRQGGHPALELSTEHRESFHSKCHDKLRITDRI